MIDFRTFFGLVHDDVTGAGPRVPHPWQERLATRLAGDRPPLTITAPTGAGKTATIDALIWALALQADRPAASRSIGVRIVWAIDRRILVDEVHDHTFRLAGRLTVAATDPADPLYPVAAALQHLTRDGSPPLIATRWRGGLRSDARAHHPLQPEVITSTVAQIGSRLLFRGYGVGERSLAVEAAMAAVDTTVCLDEAHLSEPFRQTASMIRAIRADETLALPPLNVITISATPVDAVASADTLSVTDEDAPSLGTRLTGAKTARLIDPDVAGEAGAQAALLSAISDHLGEGATTIACVVNSVRTAVDLRAAMDGRFPQVEAMLLVGPQRPADRDALIWEHHAALFERHPPTTPLVVIATQTFEVGLDADVEALVTQSASATALVQRLGRLNRLGTRLGRATIVRDIASPLYEAREPEAWAWLTSLAGPEGEIDVSVRALENAAGRPVDPPTATAPALTNEALDLLIQTSPRPAVMADPDVETFLRGVETQPSADVSIAWRCDLRPEDDGPEGVAYRQALLRLAPPLPHEQVTLDIGRARALLRARLAPTEASRRLARGLLDVGDIEGTTPDVPITELPQIAAGLRFSLLRGGEYFEAAVIGRRRDDIKGLRDIRPGDVIVLPSEVGGYANRAIAPSASGDPELDIAADLLASRGATEGQRPAASIRVPTVWRLNREVLNQIVGDESRHGGAAQRLLSRAVAAFRRSDLGEKLRPLLDELVAASGIGEGDLVVPSHTRLRLWRVGPDLDPVFDGSPDDDLLSELGDDDIDSDVMETMFADERQATEPAFVLTVAGPRNRDEMRSTEPPPNLASHAEAVAAKTAAFAMSAGLPERERNSLVLAARAHDHGKADARIQAFFRGGVPGLLGEPLAKSVFGTADLRTDRLARKAAGLPRRLRHEIASVAILDDAFETGRISGQPAPIDRDLTLHLVGTHHGLGRPIPPVPIEGIPPRPFSVEAEGVAGIGFGDGMAGWSEGEWLRRFFRVAQVYGAWGGAYLEALLILADRSVSRKGG